MIKPGTLLQRIFVSRSKREIKKGEILMYVKTEHDPGNILLFTHIFLDLSGKKIESSETWDDIQSWVESEEFVKIK